MKARQQFGFIRAFVLFSFLLLPLLGWSQTVIYVKADATGSNNGSSWTNAFTNLQDALTAADAGTEIWVASGTYTPSTNPTDRNATFQLKNGVAIYGGFAGTETDRDQRDWSANLSVLSGDINGSGNLTGNSFTVVTGSGTNDSAMLDGFTITAGNANDDAPGAPNDGPTRGGGGMVNDLGSPTLVNLHFSGNSAAENGGGLYNTRSSSPTLINVSFSGNTSRLGGGIANFAGSNPTLTNVNFSGNTGRFGGGMTNESGSNPILTDVSFENNSAEENGGGMRNTAVSSPILSNVSFSGNTARLGGGIVNFFGSNPTLTNVNFSGNTAQQGGGMYNENSNPILADVSFISNEASFHGGGMDNFENSAPTLVNVSFIGNSADRDGGGISNEGSTLLLTNVLFSGNKADVGGGIWNGVRAASPPGAVSNMRLTNVSFSGNFARFGGGIRNFTGGNADIRNSVFWNNRDRNGTGSAAASIDSVAGITQSISFSLVQGCRPGGTWTASCRTDGGNNLADTDPLFIAAVDPGSAPTLAGNLRLSVGSPVIDVGNNAFIPEGVTTDLDGNPRIFGPRVDLGAFEGDFADRIFRDRFAP